jgi:Glycosyl hydrolases family 39
MAFIRRFGGPILMASIWLAQAAPVRAESMWGVVGHFVFTDEFFDRYPAYWRLERTLPFLQRSSIKWVREGIFAYSNPQRAVVGETKNPDLIPTIRAHRQSIENYLRAYDTAGIKVLMAAVAAPRKSPDGKAYNAEFFSWLSELAVRHPCIAAIEMHNEPNLRHFWRDTPEEYVETYREAARQIRAHRPDIKILFPSLANMWWPPAVDWLKRALDWGMLDAADGISVHPYNKALPPEFDPFFDGGRSADPEHYEKAVHAFWNLIQSYNRQNRPLELYFTEFGYSSNSKGMYAIGSEDKQADYLSRLLLVHQDLKVNGIPLNATFWYDFKDDGENPDKGEHHFGLVNYDLSRVKPAYYTYSAIAKFFVDADELLPAKLNIQVGDHQELVKTKAWRRKTDGALIVAYWRLDTHNAPSEIDTTLKVELSSSSEWSKVTFYTADERPPHSASIRAHNGTAAIPVTATSRAAWVELK